MGADSRVGRDSPAHLAGLVRRAADREKSGPAWPDVPVHVGNRRSVYVEFCIEIRGQARAPWLGMILIPYRASELRDVPDARGLLKVTFFTPVLVARGMFARMRAAASACFACSSALDIIRASTDAIAAMPAARRGRRAVPNMSVLAVL